MSTSGDIFSIVKKLFLVSEDLTRFSAELKELNRDVRDHEVRLVRIETTLDLQSKAKRSHLTLPGE